VLQCNDVVESRFALVRDILRIRLQSCEGSAGVVLSMELRMTGPAALPVLTGIVADKALQTELERIEPELELDRIDLHEFQRPFRIRSSTMLPITLKGVRQFRVEQGTSTLPVEQRLLGIKLALVKLLE
jgi:hypothetical protein